MAAPPRVVTLVFTTPDEAVEYHAQHLSKGGMVVEAADDGFGQAVQVHLDMEFCGKTLIIEGTVVSATPFGTALQVANLPGEYQDFVAALERGEVPEPEEYEGTVDEEISLSGIDFDAELQRFAQSMSDDDSADDLDGDWSPPWDEEEAREAAAASLASEDGEGPDPVAAAAAAAPPPPPPPADDEHGEPDEPSADPAPVIAAETSAPPSAGFSEEAAEVIDEPPAPRSTPEPEPAPPPPPAAERAVEELDGQHITLGSGVTASVIFDDLGEMDEDAFLSEAPTLPAEGAAGVTASEARTVALSGTVTDSSNSFEFEIEEDSEDEDLDDPGNRESIDPIYATVQPQVRLGWAQPVADRPSELQGMVEAKKINDVVRQLSLERRSGILRMKLLNRLLVGIWFQGRPVHFIASPPEDGKGAAEALSALPEMDVSAYEMAIEQQQRTGGHLGLLLVASGAVSRDDLFRVVRLEAQKYASTLPMRRGGTFGFWDCDVPGNADDTPDIEAVLRWEAEVFG